MQTRVDAIRKCLATSDKIRHEGARKIMLDALNGADFAGMDNGQIAAYATNVIARAVYDAKLGPGTLDQIEQVAGVYVRTADDPRFRPTQQ